MRRMKRESGGLFRSAMEQQSGVKKAEEFFGIENLTDPDNLTIQHHVNQAIKANGVMKLDVDYVVKDGEVIIVDEFTGRLMYGRRFNEGLHQAIEAKEGVKVQSESKTLATITFQNYFRLYKKLSGMTGTAQTESEEFQEIYKLDVVEIPTNKPVLRKDLPDSVYKTENGKFHAVIDAIVEAHEKGQPVLVGTISIEKSELLSKMLKKRGIKHNVLNAKQHEKEAEIVAQAGKLGAVTIATNMAGRGTDIILGGNAEYARAEGREGVFPRALPHVPRQAVVPPGDGIGLPGRRLFRDGELFLSIQGKNKCFQGSARNGIKSLSVRSGDLPRGIERDGVTRGGDVFHVEQAVPQVPDLPQRAVSGMPDVQIG